ncbi:alanine racemase [Streptococcus sp. DD13]|uniref:alanine racemase n=1 Tax=Streptococcus sp. DD13 TaxID=1777881 RepID=UPI00079BF7E6|nr:alanine racemase [Streptococcus sp. DD13]KXT78104.1 Alanine racemase [Streptococcus sp. DD13]
MISSIHRPSQVSVDLEAIARNCKQVQENIKKDAKTMAIVKANAYGHGAVAVASYLSDQVDWFGVSNVDEALELRQAGIDQDILVLGVSAIETIPLAVKEKISVTVASLEWLNLALSRNLDLTDLAVHLKIDSGMGRIGFREEADVHEAIAILAEQGAHFQGIFTHFATADEADTVKFQAQLAFFQNVLDQLEAVPPCVHASNSATSIWHPDTVFNMVRLGDVLYGLNPSGRNLEMPYPIWPALQLESELVHIKQVEEGQDVGYGATYQTQDGEWIGTVPIGYADGFRRSMQGFKVLVEGVWCPVVGRVSMDQITLHLPQRYPIGTKVTLIGSSGDLSLSVQDWADYLGTINYEVVCGLSDRLPRRYHPVQGEG